jgi:hypothetical protein
MHHKSTGLSLKMMTETNSLAPKKKTILLRKKCRTRQYRTKFINLVSKNLRWGPGTTYILCADASIGTRGVYTEFECIGFFFWRGKCVGATLFQQHDLESGVRSQEHRNTSTIHCTSTVPLCIVGGL